MYFCNNCGGYSEYCECTMAHYCCYCCYQKTILIANGKIHGLGGLFWCWNNNFSRTCHHPISNNNLLHRNRVIIHQHQVHIMNSISNMHNFNSKFFFSFILNILHDGKVEKLKNLLIKLEKKQFFFFSELKY